MKTVGFIAVLLAFVSYSVSEDTIVVLNDKVSEQSPVQLTCGDLGTLAENDTVNWIYVDSHGANETKGSNLNLNITANTDTGTYVCYLNGEQEASYLAAKLTTPEILNTRKSVTYNDGDTNRKLTCESKDSFPDPNFVWTRRGDIEGEVPILVTSETNPNYHIETNGTKSVLTFYNVTYSESANFICEVTNAAGNATIEVLVRVKDKYAAVWPFIGIVAEVVILIAIIFLYERHSKKSESDKELTVIAEDEKPLNRDEGMEVRNRKEAKGNEVES